MREIKFRFYDEGEGLMMGPQTLQEIGLQPHLILDTDIAMQYTGLNDKNGKEIYEGDIVNVWHVHAGEGSHISETLLVAWRDPSASFTLRSNKDEADYPMELENEDYALEVIGNVMENPELLV